MNKPDDIYQKFVDAAEGWYIPPDGICPTCDKLKRRHPEVEFVLAMRKLKYFDEEKQRVVQRVGIPYCLCAMPEYLETQAPDQRAGH